MLFRSRFLGCSIILWTPSFSLSTLQMMKFRFDFIDPSLSISQDRVDSTLQVDIDSDFGSTPLDSSTSGLKTSDHYVIVDLYVTVFLSNSHQYSSWRGNAIGYQRGTNGCQCLLISTFICDEPSKYVGWNYGCLI